MSSLLNCYFPTQVMFVDDDEHLLKVLPISLPEDQALYSFFSNPFKAIQAINGSVPTDSVDRADDSPVERLSTVYKIMDNPKRHEQISVVILDYYMPAMTGLDFCAQLTNPYVRTILLTGIADETIAVDAFNQGLIHGYIKKDDPHKTKKINEFIKQQQVMYFKSLLGTLVGSSLKEWTADGTEQTALDDPVFADYFHDLIQKKNICEYYTSDPMGSFIFLSGDGAISQLYTYTKETLDRNEMETYAILRDFIDLEDPQYAPLMTEIEEGKKTLCIPPYGPELNALTQDNWMEYVLPLHTLEGGKETYYLSYAVHPHQDDDPKPYSFHQCLDNHGVMG